MAETISKTRPEIRDNFMELLWPVTSNHGYMSVCSNEMADMCVLLLQRCFLGLISGLTGCRKFQGQGFNLWTAGYRESLSTFSWKLHSVRNQRSSNNYWTSSPMDFTFWASRQPDNSGGSENCVTIWPNRNYEWNDARCSHELCFICENRNAPKYYDRVLTPT